MKTKKMGICLLMAFVLLFHGCGSAIQKSEVKKTVNMRVDQSYKDLEVSHAIDVVMSPTVLQPVMEIDEAFIPYVEYKVANNKLVIGLKDNVNLQGHILVRLPYNANLQSVVLSGASSFKSDSLINKDCALTLSGASAFNADIAASEVVVTLSGTSEIEGHMAVSHLTLNASGASEVQVTGTMETLNLILSGASSWEGGTVNNLNATLSGACKAQMECNGVINANLSGESTLCYTGSGIVKSQTLRGQSNIIKR